ncbi:hypothetical protein AAC387_Pa02g1793 [Persea americana]
MMHRKKNCGARMVGDFAGKAEEGMEVYESFVWIKVRGAEVELSWCIAERSRTCKRPVINWQHKINYYTWDIHSITECYKSGRSRT